MNWSSLNAFWEWLSSEWSSIVPPAPISFPIDPSGGQQFGRFAYNNAKGAWDFS